MRAAAGLYRQFVTQVDVSKYNAGALLPSVRIWLPVDASVRSPLAYHLTQSLLAQPAAGWTLRLEGYYKHQPHGLLVAYGRVSEGRAPTSLGVQQNFLEDARMQAYGVSAAVDWQGTAVRLRARYEYSRATQRSPALFGGRTQTTPWNEPHRAELGLDWLPTRRLTLSARGHGIRGRAWGFRQAYYDYFGQDAPASYSPYDLSRPSEHVLPDLYQLDLSLAYTRPVGPAVLQGRVEVLNATGRANVVGWRLRREGDAWEKEARHLYPRMPSVALRLSF
jgi:hypothetical protein